MTTWRTTQNPIQQFQQLPKVFQRFVYEHGDVGPASRYRGCLKKPCKFGIFGFVGENAIGAFYTAAVAFVGGGDVLQFGPIGGYDEVGAYLARVGDYSFEDFFGYVKQLKGFVFN